MKFSKDGKVVFNEKNHTYFIGEKRLEGVTSYISRFKNKFDSDLISEKYAIKHGLKKEEVLLEWKLKGEKSIIQGTAVHHIFENFILNGEIKENTESEKENTAIKFINDIFITEKLIPVECENIVYNEYLASQIDCIVRNQKGEYFILDWKTNSKIEEDSWGKYLLNQYKNIPDSSYYHYSLQLSIYKELYKEFPIKDCFIVHLKENNYEFIKYKQINYEY